MFVVKKSKKIWHSLNKIYLYVLIVYYLMFLLIDSKGAINVTDKKEKVLATL